ncbi:hypothetical protein [Deinococcus altitudinis]|uniref:hypothetical protein n=1 Tax=Deinococcus altitudinis TaxID=468914 RepID=UPI0038919A34
MIRGLTPTHRNDRAVAVLERLRHADQLLSGRAATGLLHLDAQNMVAPRGDRQMQVRNALPNPFGLEFGGDGGVAGAAVRDRVDLLRLQAEGGWGPEVTPVHDAHLVLTLIPGTLDDQDSIGRAGGVQGAQPDPPSSKLTGFRAEGLDVARAQVSPRLG